MKLLSVRTARSIWLLPLRDLNPHGRFLFPAIAGMVQRYGFAKAPEPQSVLASPLTVRFEGGAFVGKETVPRTVNLVLHDDGLVAEMRSCTEDCDLFLEDAFTWLSSEYRLPRFNELAIRRIYLSEISVQFESTLEIFNERFSRFADSLQAGLGPHQPKPMLLTHLNFGVDPATGAPQPMLRIEREAGTTFDQNRYYSSATIPTDDHLKILRKFEDAATFSCGSQSK